MKKVILLFAVLFPAMCIFAQSAPTVDPSVDPSVFDVVYNWVVGYIPAKTFAIISLIVIILEQILPKIKWTPANSTLGLIWDIFKKIVYAIANKKK